MATPPRPTHAEVAAALARIQARHERADDQHRAAMGTGPREVLDYLRRRSSNTPRATAADDVWDELILSAALHWEELERERSLLRRARSLGLSLSELGAHLGIRTRQGTQDYLDRLDALVQAGTPDVHLSREARRRAKARPADQRWLDEHHEEVHGALDRLLGQVARVFPNDAGACESADGGLEWVDELRVDVEAGDLTPATMGLLGLVLGELRVDPEVQALDRGHGVHRALRAAEGLRARYAEARRCSSGPPADS